MSVFDEIRATAALIDPFWVDIVVDGILRLLQYFVELGIVCGEGRNVLLAKEKPYQSNLFLCFLHEIIRGTSKCTQPSHGQQMWGSHYQQPQLYVVLLFRVSLFLSSCIIMQIDTFIDPVHSIINGLTMRRLLINCIVLAGS